MSHEAPADKRPGILTLGLMRGLATETGLSDYERQLRQNGNYVSAHRLDVSWDTKLKLSRLSGLLGHLQFVDEVHITPAAMATAEGQQFADTCSASSKTGLLVAPLELDEGLLAVSAEPTNVVDLSTYRAEARL